MSAVADYIDLDDLDEVLAREYLRVSFDKSGRLRSPEEQHGDNVVVLERRPTWRLGAPYEDEGSASRYAKKRRENYDKLIADLEADRFGAQVLMMWEASRGTREVWEMARLLRLCELRGVHVFITTHHRLYDPRITRDWRILMDEALDAETEVRKTSERTRRSSRADANAGRFGGGRRPFGYQANGVDWMRDPVDEVQIIRDAVRDVLDGIPIRRIAADLNERGILTSAGNRWHPGPLKAILTSPRIAGKRIHRGEVMPNCAWKGIIDEVTHKRIVAVLRDRAPVGRRGRTPWLLTGLLCCGRCSAPLIGSTDLGGTRRYVCRSSKAPGYRGCGGLTIKAEPLEEILAVLVTDRLRDVEARENAGTNPDDADELAQLDEIAVLLAEADEDRASGEMDRTRYNGLVSALTRRKRAVDARLAAKVRETSRLDLVATANYVGRAWTDLDVTEQRLILDALIERVEIAPASVRGLNRFESERVTAPDLISWRV